MTDYNSLLATYQALIQEHAEQFEPEVQALQKLLQARMQELQQRERALVEKQAVELQRIAAALAESARCLLPTPELRTFVQELKQARASSWSSRRPEATVADEPNTWRLATLALPVSLREYRTDEDPYAYDDERTHTLYTYSITLKLGSLERRLTVDTKRYYHPQEQRIYSMREQIDYFIAAEVEDMLMELEFPQEERPQLASEISWLVGYASTLLALTPRTARFEYVFPTGAV